MNECVAKGNDFSMWDNDKDLIFDREDRNGTRYYVTNKCPRCGGTGWLHEFEYVDGGICFMCHGSGFAPKPLWTKVYREEYHAKLIEKRQAKWKARAEEDNAKFFKAFGFSPKGEAWVVLGDTYSQKDALKEQGARFSEHIGWYFDHKPEMDSVHLEPDTKIGEFDEYELGIGERKRAVTFMDVDYTGHYNLTWYLNVLKDYIDEKQDEYQALHTESGAYVGAVGDKITLGVVYDGFSSFERDNPFARHVPFCLIDIILNLLNGSCCEDNPVAYIAVINIVQQNHILHITTPHPLKRNIPSHSYIVPSFGIFSNTFSKRSSSNSSASI